MLDVFAFDFMRKAMVAVVVLSLGMAPVGCFLVLRRLSLAQPLAASAAVRRRLTRSPRASSARRR